MSAIVTKNDTAVWLVRAIHIAVIIYVLFGPYLKRYFNPQFALEPATRYSSLSAYDILYLTAAMTLMVHWYAGSDLCALSKLEEYLSGKPYESGFIHRLVSPVYNFPQLGPQISFWSYVVVIVNSMVILQKNTKSK